MWLHVLGEGCVGGERVEVLSLIILIFDSHSGQTRSHIL